MTVANEHFNCAKMVSCKVTTIENQKEYRWQKGALGTPWVVGDVRGPLEGIRGVGVSGVYLGDGR